jgi:uncharacterized MnhB-related membrane protein
VTWKQRAWYLGRFILLVIAFYILGVQHIAWTRAIIGGLLVGVYASKWGEE